MKILTVGHSTHSWERFFALLQQNEVTAIADVRSAPFSRHTPHFSQSELKVRLKSDGVAYSFLGNELGGRPQNKKLYCDGVADYQAMADTVQFKAGVKRVLSGADQYRVALMCSEHNPLDCHRCLLVSRALVQQSAIVEHILGNSSVSPHSKIEEELLDLATLSGSDLFASREARLVMAYRDRAQKVAFNMDSMKTWARASAR
jgi:uncharacterized protein (DUF488 family)